MRRNNIFDILSQKAKLTDQVKKIEKLLSEKSVNGHSLEYIVDNHCIRFWNYRGMYTTCDEIRNRLNITEQDFYIRGFDLNTLLNYLEYISNLIWLCDTFYLNDQRKTSQEFQFLSENVLNLIENLDHEVKELKDGRVILVEKDPAATAAAEVSSPDIADKIIEYNHFLLKGNLADKKQILLLLADEFEGRKDELNNVNSKLVDNIGFLLNNMNIRHNNREGKNAKSYVVNMSDKELEEWYDETYQMLLLSILELDNIERNKRVEELKQKI